MPEGSRLYLLAPIVRGRKGEYRKELAELQRAASAGQGRRRFLRDRRGARPRQEAASTTSRSWSIAWWCAPDIGRPAWPKASRPHSSSATGSSWPRLPTVGETASDATSASFACPRLRLHASPRSSRGCSRSTTRSAPARPATGSGDELLIRPAIWSCPTPNSPCATAPSRPGRADASPYYQQTLARSAGISRSSMRHALARAAGAGARRDPVRLRRRADHHAARRRPARLQDQQAVRGRGPTCSAAGARPTAPGCARSWRAICQHRACETCHGARLKPEALAVKIDQRDIAEVTSLSIREAASWFGLCRPS